jgi:REP element-mobilizing transposase RayT
MKAGTFTQLYVQYVFAVRGKDSLLDKRWREEVFKYISGVVTQKGQKPIIVNGVADHLHIFVGLRPSMRISDLARDIKNNSSRFINENDFLLGKFSWQAGYGAFTYSHSQVQQVYQYILNQEEHHKTTSFREEYEGLLRQFEIDYDKRFLFDFRDK